MKTPVVLVAGATAYAALVAMTDPFTNSAQAVTAVGLAAGATALCVRLLHGRSLVADRLLVQPGVSGGSALPWVVLVVAVVGFELYCFFGGPRPQHPTLSTLYDLAARWRVVKGVVVFAWVALGWELVR